jgi:tRNA(Ile)-lysidine synthase
MLDLAPPPACIADRPVLVGFSGGLDSTVLLHLLVTQAGRGLRAIHVHHGLHPDANRWAEHCRATCDRLGVAIAVAAVEVARGGGRGPEAAARDARRAAFAMELRDGEVLALAHHRDDQAETFLLRALRGSGVDGLGAMRPWCRFARGTLWRPLLAVPRAELIGYASRHGLSWIEDPSNADVSLDRNFLRHEVLPLLRRRWPAVDAAFARSAGLASQAGALLDEDDGVALDALRNGDPDSIDLDALRDLSPPRQARVLRYWVQSLALPPVPAQGVDVILGHLLQARDDSRAEFAWDGAWVRRWQGRLHAGRGGAALPAAWRADWDGRTPLPLPGGGTLQLIGADGFAHSMAVVARQGGERITLAGRSHSHALKHVLQDLHVPPWRRERIPLLVDADGEVLAAGDIVASGAFTAWLDAHGARLAWDDGTDRLN